MVQSLYSRIEKRELHMYDMDDVDATKARQQQRSNGDAVAVRRDVSGDSGGTVGSIDGTVNKAFNSSISEDLDDR